MISTPVVSKSPGVVSVGSTGGIVLQSITLSSTKGPKAQLLVQSGNGKIRGVVVDVEVSTVVVDVGKVDVDVPHVVVVVPHVVGVDSYVLVEVPHVLVEVPQVVVDAVVEVADVDVDI